MKVREYNLFVIKQEYFDIYKNKPLFLFDILKKLYNLKDNFNYGITLYEQLCNKVSVNTLKYYLNNRYELNNDELFYIDGSLIELRYSRIILKSHDEYPKIMEVFNCYNKNIFICDFNNNDYFWLDIFSKNRILEAV